MIAEKKILVDAPMHKVWDVLVKPRHIRKWDQLPRGFGNKALDFETVIRWPQNDDQFRELTVTAIEPPAYLRLALFDSTWNDLPEEPVTYTFRLEQAGAKTRLILSIGDLGALEDGESELKKANEFVKRTLPLIKEVAEANAR